MQAGMFFGTRRTVLALATALACTLVSVPAAQAREIRIVAPIPETASAPSNADDATGPPALRPLTPEESDILDKALSYDPSSLASAEPPPTLHRPSSSEQQALKVNRTDNNDGSSSVTVTQSLADSGIDANVGADINTAAPPPTGYLSDRPLAETTDSGGSGAAWASVGLPDVASVNARVDPVNEQGQVGTVVKHAIPVGQSLSLTLQGSYSVTRTMSQPASAPRSISGLPLMTAPAPAEQASSTPPPVWGSDNSLKLNILPTGTTLTADIATASNDPVTHNSISADQKLLGPLHVTTAVGDIGQPVTNKSITAGFQLNW
jgi:hypothetical protein